MKAFISNKGFLFTAGLAFVFLLWLAISLSQGPANLIFPSPASTIGKLGELLGGSYVPRSLGMSILRTLEGFGISFAAALVLGSISGQIKPLQTFLKPLFIVLKSAPTAAFVFLFLVLVGSARAPIFVVILLAFPILYESVVAGFNALPPELLWASRIDSASKWRVLTRIKIPLAGPYIILGLVSSFALSFKTEIMAEIVTGSTGMGLGSAIRYYRNESPTDLTPIFAIALLAILVVIAFDGLSFLTKRILGVKD